MRTIYIALIFIAHVSCTKAGDFANWTKTELNLNNGIIMRTIKN